jgi:hypothetical protein
LDGWNNAHHGTWKKIKSYGQVHGEPQDSIHSWEWHKWIHMWMKIFHPTYMCIIHVLNAKHPCAKHTQKNNFRMISITKSQYCKFVISVSHMKHSDLSWALQHLFACIYKLNKNVYQHCKLGNDFLHGLSTTIKLDTYVPRSWVSWRLEEIAL